VKRVLKAFGHFWVDFLIGDSPEIFVGVAVLLAIVVPFRHHPPVALVTILALVPLLLVASLVRGRRRA
jgi:hypothetical protein